MGVALDRSVERTVERVVEDVIKTARHGATTAFGLGLLVIQQAQVHRRDLMAQSGKLLQTVGVALENRVKMVEGRLSDLNGRIEDRSDSRHPPADRRPGSHSVTPPRPGR